MSNFCSLNDLAQRAVACRAWRWMPGMACAWKPHGGASGQQIMPTWARVADLPMGPLPLTFCLVDYAKVYRGALPDLSDPATLGCLLALVREAHGAASVVYLPRDGAIRAWRVLTFAHGADWLTPARCLGEGATEAEALVAALESAP